jgi:hypothetical protein
MINLLKDLRFDLAGLAVVCVAVSVGIQVGWGAAPQLWRES